jgi:hypothetical protein
LDERSRRSALGVRDRLQSLGCPEAEGWARSEISEEIPQTARFLILRHLW